MNNQINATFLTLSLLIAVACSTTTPSQSPDDSGVTDHLIEQIPTAKLGYEHQAMVFGTFHFNKGTDASDIVGQNILDVTSEENQAQLEQITDRIAKEYRPTVVAIEFMPSVQNKIDSLYAAYLDGTWSLGLNEAFQIGFRVAKKAGLEQVHCIDNRPPQPESVVSLDDWDAYAEEMGYASIWYEYDAPNAAYNTYLDSIKSDLNLVEYLQVLHSENNLVRSKELWLTGLVNLGHGDNFAGADLTGHWYNRNTRIFVNARNLATTKLDRILVIYGNAHKWILDELFDSSPEFELIQPKKFF